MIAALEPTIVRDLGDGLILRRSTAADADALADFNSRIHSDNGPDNPDLRLGALTRDMLLRPHPTFAPDDFTIVEDTRTGQIVSSMDLISQTWAYCGIPFGVGRPELVGTLPEFRNRGLVRAQFEVVHRWSAERGQMVQAITGIPYYYRLFGYEMALNLGGGRSGFAPQLPKLKEGETEPYTLRDATAHDIAFVAEVYAQAVAAREPITCARTPAEWRHEIEGRSQENIDCRRVCVIESAAGEAVGYVIHPEYLWEGGPGTTLPAIAYELKPGVSWLAVTPSVARALWERGEQRAAARGKRVERFAFALGAAHPVYDAWRDRLPNPPRLYAWYLRVPDLPGFVRHIAPALETRLARSLAPGWSGELKLSFYKTGLRLTLEDGRLKAADTWRPAPGDEGQAGFPDLSFLQLLFGYRDLDELHHAFADCWYGDNDTRTVLTALFPKQVSNVLPII
jgi:hypothetical protein